MKFLNFSTFPGGSLSAVQRQAGLTLLAVNGFCLTGTRIMLLSTNRRVAEERCWVSRHMMEIKHLFILYENW